jgi:hypothetical protein
MTLSRHCSPTSAFALACALALLNSPSHAQTLIKCVDDRGVTHYGETLPAACAKREVTEMNKQGRAVRKIDAPLTAEQQKAREESAQRKASDDRKVADQRQKDMALIATFGNDREVDAMRDKDLVQFDQRRRSLEARIKEVDTRLAKLTAEMDFYVAGRSQSAKARETRETRETPPAKDGKDTKGSKDAKPESTSAKDANAKDTNAKGASAKTRDVPPQLQADYDRTTSDRRGLLAEITRVDAEKQVVTKRYDDQKDRLRRLKGGMRPGTILDEQGNVLIDAPLPRQAEPAPTKPAPRR